jgi:transglutaminase-like putative cysteine protease
MRFFVHHLTIYRYSAPVRLAEHVLRFNPRPDAGRLLTRQLAVDPAPFLQEDAADAFGNLVTRVDFEAPSDHLLIDSRFEFEADAGAPLARGAPPPLPWPVEAHGPHAVYRGNGAINGAVGAFAAEIAAECGGDALAFLDRLNRTLYARIDRRMREEGAARSAEETLALGSGACRDLTVLFVAACRSLGAPARFVSGYQARADAPDGRRHLHAWPEAFVPGLGWRGYDPTHGFAVSDGHVPLCAAPEQAQTMPVEGRYFGGPVKSSLAYEIEIAVEAN